jgi:excinuclease UvrABC nuclease subunit
MKMASLKLDFESAAKIRDQIQYLEGASNWWTPLQPRKEV